MQDTEADYHNFSSSSHRLPTISGTQAVRNAIRISKPVSSGLAKLDAVLGASTVIGGAHKGFKRGVVTEVFGPPGCGKTTLAIQAAVNTIRSDESSSVTWIDTSSALIAQRVRQVLHGSLSGSNDEAAETSALDTELEEESLLERRFRYRRITNLSRLLALLVHPPFHFPGPNTSLMVFDDLSNLLLSTLPRAANTSRTSGTLTTPSAIRNNHVVKQAASRRYQILTSFASALQAFAAARNIAILVISKATINLKAGQRAILRPALSSQQWDGCLDTRVAIYRGFQPRAADSTSLADATGTVPEEHGDLRFAQVLRMGGKDVSGPEIGFVITLDGLHEISSSTTQSQISIVPLINPVISDCEDLENDPGDVGNNIRAEIDVSSDLDCRGPDASVLRAEPDAGKRKAIEISDSEDDAQDAELGSSQELNLPPRSSFQRASQIDQSNVNAGETLNAKRLRFVEPVPDQCIRSFQTKKLDQATEKNSDEEMLLDEYEAHPPFFSQAAAEMSDPLTPSDHNGPSP